MLSVTGDWTWMGGRRPSAFGVAAALAVGLAAPSALAQDDSDELNDSPAWRANVGLHLGTSIIVLVPDRGDSLGVGLQVEGRYGIGLGPIVVAPGAELSGYLLASRVVGTLLPTVRLTVPIGPLAPFVRAGVGIGGLTDPSEGGLAWLAGAGLMLHVSDAFSFGAELGYQAIEGTDFKGLSIAPTLSWNG
ncbi:MAG: hypothetical protein ABI895_16245 [Deltaproteobacteria bacterium]